MFRGLDIVCLGLVFLGARESFWFLDCYFRLERGLDIFRVFGFESGYIRRVLYGDNRETRFGRRAVRLGSGVVCFL